MYICMYTYLYICIYKQSASTERSSERVATAARIEQRAKSHTTASTAARNGEHIAVAQRRAPWADASESEHSACQLSSHPTCDQQHNTRPRNSKRPAHTQPPRSVPTGNQQGSSNQHRSRDQQGSIGQRSTTRTNKRPNQRTTTQPTVQQMNNWVHNM